MEIALGIILLVAAIFLVGAVLLQQGSDGVSAAVTGGAADTYFGKNKGKSRDKLLSKLTMIVGIIFVVVVIVVYIIQPDPSYDEYFDPSVVTETEAAETDAEPAETSEAGETGTASTEAAATETAA